ncbi:MAG TPA: hypothetical protein VJ793_21695 [Anaerolineae bacterium]|nr:hypothetical protein [Anaerolineae bacterium]
MKRLIKFPLQDGGSVIVEVDEPLPEGVVEAARPGEVVAKAKETLEDALERFSRQRSRSSPNCVDCTTRPTRSAWSSASS